MPELYSSFDFRVLDDRDFREDSVREELIAPLLVALGYSASGPDRIIRSRPLEHPFVQIGTRRQAIRIVPDYLMQRGGKNAWILDAKSPSEVIDSGENVEQAYSYAIHKDIRVPLYALCNGREFIIFNVSDWPAVFRVPLQDITAEDNWKRLLFYVGTLSAMPHGIPLGFSLDYGLHVAKSGIHQSESEVFYIFESVPVVSVGKVDDSLYCINALYGEDGLDFIITFDLTSDLYANLLDTLPKEIATRVQAALSRQPFQFIFELGTSEPVGVVAKLGDRTHTNPNESYRPFVAAEFFRAAVASPASPE